MCKAVDAVCAVVRRMQVPRFDLPSPPCVEVNSFQISGIVPTNACQPSFAPLCRPLTVKV